MKFIDLDGSEGEGGGQILRSSLALSAVTGIGFNLKNIRAGRKKPGLMRQHLTAVQAAKEICGAEVVGAELNSTEISFSPKKIVGGEFHFQIGTAGSATLILQTILPPLLNADGESVLVIEGGTHNSMAPTFDFLKMTYLPVLAKMGIEVELTLSRWGFYPAGGGCIEARIFPWKKRNALEFLERGNFIGKKCRVVYSNLEPSIALREVEAVKQFYSWGEDEVELVNLRRGQGPGNVLLFELLYENINMVVSAFGEKGISVNKVVSDGCTELKEYLSSSAVADEYLADQLLLPLAMVGGGRFSAVSLSSHTETNMAVIEKFLPGKFICKKNSENDFIISWEK